VGLGALSAGAAVVHLLVTPEHFRQDILFGAFFLVVATLQLAWSAAILQDRSNFLYLVGGIGNALILMVWAVSRTAGVPIGPNAGVPEPVAAIDALASAYEVIIVAACLYLVARGSERANRTSSTTIPGWVSVVVVLVLPVLAFLVGGHPHSPNGTTGVHSHLLAHHLFHLVFIGGAALIFCGYVAVLVAHEGWPTFSWRIDPTRGD
jgi:hypothetical protein